MKVAEVLALIDVWKLHGLDQGRDVVLLSVDANGVSHARYEGLHVSGVRSDPHVSIVDLKPGAVIGVDGDALAGILGIVGDDEQIKMGLKPPHLYIRAGAIRNKLRLKEIGTPPPDMKPPFGGMNVQEMEFKPKDMLDRVSVLADVTTKAASNPGLSGIHIATDGTRLVMQASDASRGCETILIPDAIRGSFELILAGQDLVTALPLLGETATMLVEDTRVWIADAATAIRLSPLSAKFPDFSRLPQTYPTTMVIPTAPLAVAAKAASYLDASATKVVTITVVKGVLTLSVEGRETGSFTLEVGQGVDQDITIRIPASAIGLLEKLGGEVGLGYGRHSVIRFSGRGFGYWIPPLMSPATV